MTDQLEMMPDEGKQDSPRLAWMKRHGVNVRLNEFRSGEWIATCGDWIVGADTSDGAIENVAKLSGIPLWNEEEYINGKEA